MVNLELQNYVKSSRAAGVPDDQIRQTLSTQGWSEADISQSLNSMGSAVSQADLAHSGYSRLFLGSKGIMTSVVVLILLGLGGYFLFASRNNTPQPDTGSTNINKTIDTSNQDNSANNTEEQKEITDPPFGCKDLLTNAEFESATGTKIADYTFSTKISKFGEKVGTLNCTYTKPGYVFGFSTSWYGKDLTALQELEAKQSHTMVPELGYKSYVDFLGMYVVDTNQKYYISVSSRLPSAELTSFYDTDFTNPKSIGYKINFGIAKSVNNNLNKY